jgi:hypothetical protein
MIKDDVESCGKQCEFIVILKVEQINSNLFLNIRTLVNREIKGTLHKDKFRRSHDEMKKPQSPQVNLP